MSSGRRQKESTEAARWPLAKISHPPRGDGGNVRLFFRFFPKTTPRMSQIDAEFLATQRTKETPANDNFVSRPPECGIDSRSIKAAPDQEKTTEKKKKRKCPPRENEKRRLEPEKTNFSSRFVMQIITSGAH